MIWDNDKVLRFLELYQMNTCIWDPQNQFHRDRQTVREAWNNIKDKLGVACSVKELKKKKESLMAAYRHYKNKIKKTELSGLGDIYQPTWFAFAHMDAFLGALYTGDKSRITEDEETFEDTNTTTTTSEDKTYMFVVTDELNGSKPTTSQEPAFFTPIPSDKKRRIERSDKKHPPELQAKQHNKHTIMKQISQGRNHTKNADDECSIFGQLVASKMRRLSEARRDVMMVKINQLFVDEHKQGLDSRSAFTSSPQFQEVYYCSQSPTQAPVEEATTFDKPSRTVKAEECSSSSSSVSQE